MTSVSGLSMLSSGPLVDRVRPSRSTPVALFETILQDDLKGHAILDVWRAVF